MRTKPLQLSVFAVAALAIVAVAAVMLMSGGAAAQATTATVSPNDDGGGALQQTDPTPTPRHATPEPCPEEEGNTNTQEGVVSTGHIALFDVWWNDDEGELTNNPCPPTVEHVPGRPRQGNKPATPARDDRTASNINIEQTIIHVQNSAKVDLSASDTP